MQNSYMECNWFVWSNFLNKGKMVRICNQIWSDIIVIKRRTDNSTQLMRCFIAALDTVLPKIAPWFPKKLMCLKLVPDWFDRYIVLSFRLNSDQLFRWNSFWSWRVCKQPKMSHLGHRKPTLIHWKADSYKTSHCLVQILA